MENMRNFGNVMTVTKSIGNVRTSKKLEEFFANVKLGRNRT